MNRLRLCGQVLANLIDQRPGRPRARGSRARPDKPSGPELHKVSRPGPAGQAVRPRAPQGLPARADAPQAAVATMAAWSTTTWRALRSLRGTHSLKPPSSPLRHSTCSNQGFSRSISNVLWLLSH